MEKETLIRNASLVLTMDPGIGEGDLGVLHHADILIVGQKISAIGQALQLKAPESAEIIEGRDKVVMPGFVDVHNHLWQSLIRGCGGNKRAQQWLADYVYPLIRAELKEADSYSGVYLSALDLLNSGVTTVVDWSHSFSSDFVKGNLLALKELGIRFCYCHKVTSGDLDARKGVEAAAGLISDNPLATLQVGAHPGLDTALLSSLEAAASIAAELNLDLHVHLRDDIGDLGKGQFQALRQANALGSNLLAAHAIHLNDREIELLAEHNVRLAYNPLSNMRMGSGIMRYPDIVRAGIKVGLGLDGGANDTSDMFNNIRTAVGLQRAKYHSTEVEPGTVQALRLATMGGAEVLNMADRIGSVTPGKQADLLVLNPATLNFAPVVDPISQIVFNGQSTNVEWVIVDGCVLKKEGCLVNDNIPNILAAAQQSADKIKRFLQ